MGVTEVAKSLTFSMASQWLINQLIANEPRLRNASIMPLKFNLSESWG
jgi:hypothetical protein